MKCHWPVEQFIALPIEILRLEALAWPPIEEWMKLPTAVAVTFLSAKEIRRI